MTSIPQLILTVMIPCNSIDDLSDLNNDDDNYSIKDLPSDNNDRHQNISDLPSDDNDRHQNINDLPSDDNDRHQNINDLPSGINKDCHHDINSLPNDTLNLASIKLPPKIRKRGRPRGADLTVIGLPRRKKSMLMDQ